MTPFFYFLDTEDIVHFYLGGCGCSVWHLVPSCALICLCLCSLFFFVYNFHFGLCVLGCLSFVSCFRVVLGSMCE